jgi:TolA-binding protein
MEKKLDKTEKEEKMKRVLFLPTAILLLVLPTACGEKKESTGEQRATTADVKKEAKEAVGTAISYTQQQKEEYQKQLEAKIREYDRKLEDLKAKAEKMEKKTKAEAQRELEDLRQKGEAAKKKLEGMKSAGSKAWEDLKSGMDAAMEDLEKSFSRMVSRFK